MSVLTTSIQHNFYPTHEVLAKVIQQEKEIKSTHMEKDEVKNPLKKKPKKKKNHYYQNQ